MYFFTYEIYVIRKLAHKQESKLLLERIKGRLCILLKRAPRRPAGDRHEETVEGGGGGLGA